MLRKIITYTNPFTEEQVTEEHYFHISKADLIEMQMEENAEAYVTKDGRELSGMEAKIQRLIDAEEGKEIMAILKDIILRSYGKKEGDRFIRNQVIREEFESSEAFSQLLFDLATDSEQAAEFTKGALPSNAEIEAAAAQIKRSAASQAVSPAVADAPSDPTGLTNEVVPQVLTHAEAAALDRDELQSGLISGKYKLS